MINLFQLPHLSRVAFIDVDTIIRPCSWGLYEPIVYNGNCDPLPPWNFGQAPKKTAKTPEKCAINSFCWVVNDSAKPKKWGLIWLEQNLTLIECTNIHSN